MQPSDEISKTASLLELIRNGRNVATTHALLSSQQLTTSLYEDLRTYSYTLVLDEVLDVVIPEEISKDDMHMLFDTGKIAADERGGVKWLDTDYKGKFSHLKRKADSRSLIWFERQLFLWLFPIELLLAFTEVFVLTFLFAGSHLKYYLDIYHVGYSLHYIDDGLMVDGVQDLSMITRKITPLIEIYQGKLNEIGEKKTSLSVSWYRNNRKTGKAKSVTLNAYNFLRHKCNARSDESLWTIFKENVQKHPIPDYQSGYCPCNARATNTYKSRDCLAYLVNIYDQPLVKRWFKGYGVTVNEDVFALSQLLQWIWRSAIRDGEPIRIYIPSSRMRGLLEEWLKNPNAGTNPAR